MADLAPSEFNVLHPTDVSDLFSHPARDIRLVFIYRFWECASDMLILGVYLEVGIFEGSNR